MTSGMKTVIYPVKDIARSKELFSSLLDSEPVQDEPYYVGFKVGDLDVGLDPNAHRHGMTAYWHVDDIKDTLQRLLEEGAEALEDVRDVGGGRLIASVNDQDGNIIGLLQDP